MLGAFHPEIAHTLDEGGPSPSWHPLHVDQTHSTQQDIHTHENTYTHAQHMNTGYAHIHICMNRCGEKSRPKRTSASTTRGVVRKRMINQNTRHAHREQIPSETNLAPILCPQSENRRGKVVQKENSQKISVHRPVAEGHKYKTATKKKKSPSLPVQPTHPLYGDSTRPLCENSAPND